MRYLAAVSAIVVLVAPACAGEHRSGSETTPVASAPSTNPPPVAAPAPTTPAPQTKNWTALAPGDCLADPPPTDPAVVSVAVLDCAAPHAAEVYARVSVTVNAAIADVAQRNCADGLRRYTGGRTGAYTVTYLIDSEQDRTSNNPLPSSVICVLTDPGGAPLTGSARR